MSAAPYNDFEDSYTIVSSTSLPRRGGGDGSQEIEEISSLHSIILDNVSPKYYIIILKGCWEIKTVDSAQTPDK